MNHSRFSDITEAEVKAALAEGDTIRGMAEVLECSVTKAYRLLEQFDIELGARGRKKVLLTEKMLAPYTEGYSFKEIAAVFGCSPFAVRNAFIRHNLKKQDCRNRRMYFDCDL